jgi:hypothetical protein
MRYDWREAVERERERENWMPRLFWSVNLKGGDHLGERDRRTCRNNIKTDITQIGFEGVGWVPLSQDRGHCQVFMALILKFCVP